MRATRLATATPASVAVAEKTAALLTVDYLKARGARGNAALVDRLIGRVPDVPAVAGDELPRILTTGQEEGKKRRKLTVAQCTVGSFS